MRCVVLLTLLAWEGSTRTMEREGERVAEREDPSRLIVARLASRLS